MPTILEILKQGVSNYPVPAATLEGIVQVRGVAPHAEASAEILLSKEYRLADADVKRWVATAPNVTQDGISFDLLVSTRDLLRAQANMVYKEFGDPNYEEEEKPVTVTYGYKGKKL